MNSGVIKFWKLHKKEGNADNGVFSKIQTHHCVKDEMLIGVLYDNEMLGGDVEGQ